MSQPPLLFQPSQADVRRFFCAVYAKAQMNQALEAIETIASLWIDEHPEYQEPLSDVNAALLQLSEADTQSDGAAARADGAYLWPLSANYNANFRGVIFVEGRVGVSGVVRGRGK